MTYSKPKEDPLISDYYEQRRTYEYLTATPPYVIFTVITRATGWEQVVLYEGCVDGQVLRFFVN